MKKFILLYPFLLCIILFIGCTNTNTNTDQIESVDMLKISTNSQELDQSSSNRAKEILSKKEHVTAVQAANTSDKLLITVEIPHHERLFLAKIRKQLKKDIEKEFPQMDVELSTDLKIILELESLEKKLRDNRITSKKLEKEIDHIIKLSKEQT